MRAALVLSSLCLSLCLAGPARAQTPLVHLIPPQGTFFDDAIAISSDGTKVVAIATDAATKAELELWDLAQKDAPPAQLDGIPTTVTRLELIAPDRILVVDRRPDGRLEAQLVSKRGSALVADKRKLGPADEIESVTIDGKRDIALYERRAGKKPGAEHNLTLVGADGRVIAKRSYTEDAEGGLRTRAGVVRMLWWSHGHTRLAAQRVGTYDKEKDIRRPDQLVRLDMVNDKVTSEHEIEDLLAFTKMTLAHKTQPDAETFVRLSDDHKQLVVDTDLTESVLPLVRPLAQYEPGSLVSNVLRDQQLLVSLQVDPNNAAAIERRVPDKDEIDLYELDLTTLNRTLSMPRVLVLPGLGRPARVTASQGRVLVLRKDVGFDRGGVALDVFALP